jgi:hypothetical protein
MTPGILRQVAAQRPFRPFRLIVTGGHEVFVSAPDRITIPNPDTAKVRTDDGALHIIDLNHVIEIRSSIEDPRARSGRSSPPGIFDER